jgi:hypothetical protein
MKDSINASIRTAFWRNVFPNHVKIIQGGRIVIQDPCLA